MKLTVIYVARSALRRRSCVQIANISVSVSNAPANIMGDLILMFMARRPLSFRQFRLDETAETDVYDQRGRQQSFTQEAKKRAENS